MSLRLPDIAERRATEFDSGEKISPLFVIQAKADKQLIVDDFRILWPFSSNMEPFLDYGTRNLYDLHALLSASSNRRFAT
jgi:hypothetical protein